MSEIIPLIVAGDRAGLEALLAAHPENAAERNSRGVSALLLCLYHGQTGLAGLLRPLLDELDIFEAAALGETQRLTELLDADAEAQEAYAADGFTALQLACYLSQPAAARLLISHGADIEAVSDNAMQLRAIHAAAASGNNEALADLLEAGADPDAEQQNGFVALHACAQNGNAEGLKLLLEHGADARLKSSAGKSAADYAHEAGHEELAALLAQALEPTVG